MFCPPRQSKSSYRTSPFPLLFHFYRLPLLIPSFFSPPSHFILFPITFLFSPFLSFFPSLFFLFLFFSFLFHFSPLSLPDHCVVYLPQQCTCWYCRCLCRIPSVQDDRECRPTPRLLKMPVPANPVDSSLFKLGFC